MKCQMEMSNKEAYDSLSSSRPVIALVISREIGKGHRSTDIKNRIVDNGDTDELKELVYKSIDYLMSQAAERPK